MCVCECIWKLHTVQHFWCRAVALANHIISLALRVTTKCKNAPPTDKWKQMKYSFLMKCLPFWKLIVRWCEVYRLLCAALSPRPILLDTAQHGMAYVCSLRCSASRHPTRVGYMVLMPANPSRLSLHSDSDYSSRFPSSPFIVIFRRLLLFSACTLLLSSGCRCSASSPKFQTHDPHRPPPNTYFLFS